VADIAIGENSQKATFGLFRQSQKKLSLLKAVFLGLCYQYCGGYICYLSQVLTALKTV
jgi:hypothetical protein